MLRLNDFPHVSQVNGMSFVWAERAQEETVMVLNEEASPPATPSSPVPLHSSEALDCSPMEAEYHLIANLAPFDNN